jgi:hypothetical protein
LGEKKTRSACKIWRVLFAWNTSPTYNVVKDILVLITMKRVYIWLLQRKVLLEVRKNVTLYLFTCEIQVTKQVLLSTIQSTGVPLKAVSISTNRAPISWLRFFSIALME